MYKKNYKIIYNMDNNNKITDETTLIEQIENYKKRIMELEEENKKLSVRYERNNNPFAQSLVVYKDQSRIYLYGEKKQLQEIAIKIPEQPFDLDMSFSTYGSWGPSLQFTSIASVYTILLRNGFKFLYEGKAHLSSESSYFIEVWYREY